MKTTVHFKKIKNLILENLSTTVNKVSIAVAWFTNEEIFEKLISLLEDKKSVTLVILDDFINNGPFGLDFQTFIDKGGNFYYGTIENPVHHKFCIIDNKMVLTGSYNWTYYAEYKNYENIVKIEDQEIAEVYLLEFENFVNALNKRSTSTKYEEYDTTLTDFFATKEYLSNDLVLRGINLNKLELIENAKKLNLTNKLFIEETTKMLNLHIDQTKLDNSINAIEKIPILPQANTINPISHSTINKKSLGISARIDNVDDRFSVLIKKGTKLPTTQESLFYTVGDNQTSISVNTHKGEDLQASKNPLLGKILINDLPPLPAGEATIKVTFVQNEKGDLRVTVISNKTGNSLEAHYYNTLE